MNRLLCAAVTIALTTGLAQAEPQIRKSTSYYQIGGRTAEDLDRELERNGPYMNSTGARHPGATEIKFGGEVTYVDKGKRCEIGEVNVTLNTKLVLPRWKNRRRAEADLALIWDALSSDIKRHEERHAEIARQHARQLDRDIRKIRPQRTCELLQEKVGQVTEKAVESHDAAQMRFDRVEAINFESRLMRIMSHRLQQAKGK